MHTHIFLSAVKGPGNSALRAMRTPNTQNWAAKCHSLYKGNRNGWFMKKWLVHEEMADSRAFVNVSNGHTNQLKWLPLAKIKIQINNDMNGL